MCGKAEDFEFKFYFVEVEVGKRENAYTKMLNPQTMVSTTPNEGASYWETSEILDCCFHVSRKHSTLYTYSLTNIHSLLDIIFIHDPNTTTRKCVSSFFNSGLQNVLPL